MVVRRDERFAQGYTPIAELDGLHSTMLLDVGVLVLEPEEVFRNDRRDRERAYLLLDGEVEFRWAGESAVVSRQSVLDEGPTALHVSAGTPVEIRAIRGSELVVEQVANPTHFESVLHTPATVRSQRFGEGTLQETSTRTVRTIFDAATNEASGMVLGEVINHPGKWSSYPPHAHAHPEVYHYRFFPSQGFGFAQAGNEVEIVHNRDTLLIDGGVVHPQTAAPGYAMFYVWMIPNLPGDRFGPDSRVFAPEHTWVMEPDQTYWPQRPMKNEEGQE